MSIEEARVHARARFRNRLERGEKIGGCDCADDAAPAQAQGAGPVRQVVGVRFRDSGRTYFFDPRDLRLEVGDWVVVETSRGREAGRVIIAPHQVLVSQLSGDLKPIHRRLSQEDIERMAGLKQRAADAVRTFKDRIRQRNLPMKAISADFSFDGSYLTLNYSSSGRIDARDLAKDLASVFGCRVELKQVGPRDEARLLGGLGRCGRTLCCSSWLPVYPEISMGMAKTQDLSLNPQKVSGVCGRLLCCLSYENEQYKQMKAVMPRLGQTIETPQGPGFVVSLQILKDLVTVRLSEQNADVVFPSADLGFRKPDPVPAQVAQPAPVQETSEEDSVDGAGSSKRRRRRKRPAMSHQHGGAGQTAPGTDG